MTSYSELVASGGVVYCPNIVHSGKNFGLINADLSDHQVGDRVYAEQGYDAPEQENLREYRLLSLEVAALTHDMPWFVTERAAPAILLPVESRARLEADGVGDNICFSSTSRHMTINGSAERPFWKKRRGRCPAGAMWIITIFTPASGKTAISRWWQASSFTAL